MVYGDQALKRDVARLSRQARQVQVEGARFKWFTEQLGNKRRYMSSPGFFLCVCAHELLPLRQRRQGVQSVREWSAGDSSLAKCKIPAEQNINRESSGRLD